MAGHAKLSASQTKKWWNCTGSIPWEDHLDRPREPSGDAARQGTCAHALLEHCLKSGKQAGDYQDRVIVIVHENTAKENTKMLPKNSNPPLDGSPYFLVDDDMIDAVQAAIDYVYKRVIELGLAPGKDPGKEVVALVKQNVVMLEQKVNPLPERSDTGGTGDIAISCWPDILETIDYKHGAGVFVPVDKNHQLRSYTVGNTVADGFSYEKYRYTIIQPRHRNAPYDGVMSEDITPEELKAWQEQLREKAYRVDSARSDIAKGATIEDLFKTGHISVGEDGSHCVFCNLKPECPAAIAKLQETLAIDFADDPETPDVPGDNQLAVMLPWVPFLESFLKTVVGAAEKKLLAGGKIDGYKLVRGKSNRKWKDESKETMAKIAEEYSLDIDKLVFTEEKILSGPKVEALIRGKDDKKAFSDKYMFKPEGGVKMAPASDRAPAVESNVGSDFSTEFDDE